MIILQPLWSSESSSQRSMIIGSMTLLSTQFSLQYSFSILTTCSSAFVYTCFVIFPKAAYVSSLTSFNRKVVLFLATKPLTCAHINYIGLSSQCRTGVLNTSCPCKLTILSVLCTTGVFFCFIFSYNTFLVSVAEKGMLCCVR